MWTMTDMPGKRSKMGFAVRQAPSYTLSRRQAAWFGHVPKSDDEVLRLSGL